MNCPACRSPIPSRLIRSEAGRLAGSVTSEAKARAVRENGKLGGRPRKAKPKTLR